MSSVTPDSAGLPASLPVLQIVKQGLLLPSQHIKTLVRVALPLIVVVGMLWLFVTWFFQSVTSQQGSFWLGFLGSLALVAAVSVVVSIALVGCHRVFILGEEGLANYGLVWWTPRETRFVGWGLAISLCAAGVALLLSLLLAPLAAAFLPDDDNSFSILLFAVVALLFNIVSGYFIARWSLVFPATAVDQRPSLGWAWDLSANDSWSVVFLISWLPLSINFLLGLLPDVDSIIFDVFLTVLGVYVLVAEVAFLSLTYTALAEMYPELAKTDSGSTKGEPLEAYEQYSPLLFQDTEEYKQTVTTVREGEEMKLELTFSKTKKGYRVLIVPDFGFIEDHSFKDIRAAVKYLHENSPFRVADFT